MPWCISLSGGGMMIRFALPLIIITFVFSVCSSKTPKKSAENNPDCNPPVSDLSRDTPENGIEVTFYPAYGYREGARKGADWLIPMRIWVHENRGSPITQLEKMKAKAGQLATKFACAGADENVLKQRLRDFSANDVKGRRVEIMFDSDPDGERFKLGKSNGNGLIESKLK